MKRTILAALAVTALAVGVTACDTGAAAKHPFVTGHGDHHNAHPQVPAKVKTKPHLTTAQAQAVGSAQDYLQFQHFSRMGLVHQLTFEHYSVRDATFAVDHIKVNWNNQAIGSAKEYLGSQHFSRIGLIQQLVFDKYTQAQAIYGVNHTGL